MSLFQVVLTQNVNHMKTEENEKMYTVISFNESKTILRFIQLTILQLEIFFPKYVIRILSDERVLKNRIDIKFRNYSFTVMTIDSKEQLALELVSSEFNELSRAGTFKVLTKIRERLVDQEMPISETTIDVSITKPQTKMNVVPRSNYNNTTSNTVRLYSYYCSSLTLYIVDDDWSSIFQSNNTHSSIIYPLRA